MRSDAAKVLSSYGMLNPYELLGVTPNSSVSDVRKSYYALACLCHPDRGGTNNQMRTLYNAYSYLIEQVSANRSVTYDQLEDEFAQFCARQTACPPRFADIHAEAFNLPRFNDLFESVTQSEEMDGAFADGGYATVPSDIGQGGTDYDPSVTSSNESLESFSTDMIEYKEPSPLVMPLSTVRDLTAQTITDFSCPVGKLQACDYRVALSEPHEIPCQRPDEDVTCAFHARSALYSCPVASR